VSDAARQLPLHLALDVDNTLDNFYSDDGTAALCASLRDAGEALQFLHGPAATGKTHLLQAACRHAGSAALYLPLAELIDGDPARLFADLEGAPLLSLDDVHVIAGSAAWEEALFHLVNRCRVSGCQLLFAAQRPPGDCGIELADLRSRLAGGVTWALPARDEAGRAEILRFRAARRGLVLQDAVVDYLCARASRALPDLLAILDRLDSASLERKRAVTVPLVRDVMGW
jgi:DnaA family protein